MQPSKPFDEMFQKQQTEAEAILRNEYSSDPNVHMSREALDEFSTVISGPETRQRDEQNDWNRCEFDSRRTFEYDRDFFTAVCSWA